MTDHIKLIGLRAEFNRNQSREMTYDHVLIDIQARTSDMAGFWTEVEGWAPDEAAKLLRKSRFDRIADLAKSMSRWDVATPLSEGDLILAWANLGAVVEGCLRLLLCVYLLDYRADEKLRDTSAFNRKKEKLLDPDGITLQSLIEVGTKDIFPPEQIEYCKLLQSRRNAVHAFKDRYIGTTEEFEAAVREARILIISINHRLPYPHY